MTPEEKRAKQAEYMRGWYSKNKEKVCASMRESRRANPEKHRRWDRNKYVRARDVILAKDREKRRIFREANPRLNESAFDQITEESAYWAGFLMADGCISNDSVILQLAQSDLDHVAAFSRFLRLDRDPFLNRGNAVIAARSKRLCAALSRFGVVPRKTMIASVRELESNRHFWRGVIDGDGSIVFPSRMPNYPYLSLVGSRTLMEQFRDYASTLLCGRTNSVRPHKSIWNIGFGGSYALPLIREMYGNCAVSLERKLLKAKKALQYVPAPQGTGRPNAYLRTPGASHRQKGVEKEIESW